MRGIGGKSLLTLKGTLKPLKHAVEGGGKAGKFILARRETDPAFQVLCLMDGRGGGMDAVEGAKGATANGISAPCRQQQKERQGEKRP